MKVIVCVEDNYGMLFNQRRVSRDQKVLEDILNMTEELWIHSFSEKMFAGRSVTVNDHLLECAKEGTYCFIENQQLLPYADRIEELVVYHWNRKYPSDFKLDMDLKQWKKISKEEFAGFSHDKITKEIYRL